MNLLLQSIENPFGKEPALWMTPTDRGYPNTSFLLLWLSYYREQVLQILKLLA